METLFQLTGTKLFCGQSVVALLPDRAHITITLAGLKEVLDTLLIIGMFV
jgi:hypothetical protein